MKNTSRRNIKSKIKDHIYKITMIKNSKTFYMETQISRVYKKKEEK